MNESEQIAGLMRTLGIDLSSAKEGTAACMIVWKKGAAVVQAPELQCDDEKLDELIAKADVVGIDAPFGWPMAFIKALQGWKEMVWSREQRRRLQFRATDLYVHEKIRILPLSVSSDRIALPAMRATCLLKRHGVLNRGGDGKFFEVYPAATLNRWNLPCRGYKALDPECKRVRKKILTGLRKQMECLHVGDEHLQTSDALDALVASLTARVAAQGLTDSPPTGSRKAARVEGWIHLPMEFPRP